MTSVIPTYGNEPNPYAEQFLKMLQQDSLLSKQISSRQQMGMLEAQTADLDRRGDAYTATLNNADKLTAAVGSLPLLSILNKGVDPSQGLGMSPEALELTAGYGQEADQHRLMQDFAKGFKDAGQGAAYFVDKVGQMPDLAAVGGRQWPGFSSVPRGGQLGGGGGGGKSGPGGRVIDEVVEIRDKQGNLLSGVRVSRDPNWAVNMNATIPDYQRKLAAGEIVMTTRPLYGDGSIGDYTYRSNPPAGGVVAPPATNDVTVDDPLADLERRAQDLLGEGFE